MYVVRTAQISRNPRSEKPARRHGQRAAEVDHAGEGAAVEDVEAVLFMSQSTISESASLEGIGEVGGNGWHVRCVLS